MTTFKFRSNIKCSGCIARVSPVLDNTTGIDKWQVDTLSPDKILTVETGILTSDEIREAVARAGFRADPL